MYSASVRRKVVGTPQQVEVHVVKGNIFTFCFYQNDAGFTFGIEGPGDFWVESEDVYITLLDANREAEARLKGLPEARFSRHRSMLHLYLRHRRDTKAYGNEWSGDFKVASITTYATVADYYRAILERGERLRIHRRKFELSPATICCECAVKAVEPVVGTNGFKVEFHESVRLSIEVEKRLQQGYYFAASADYEPSEEEQAENL